MCGNNGLDKISFELFYSINSVDKEQWEIGLEKDDFYMNYHFLSITENTTLGIDSYYYIMMYLDGVKIANFVLFSIELDFYNLVGNSMKGLIAKFRKINKKAFFIKTIFCGLPISTVDNSIRIFNKQYTKELLELLDQITKELVKKENSKIVFYKDFCDGEIKWTEYLKEKSNILISGLPSNNLMITWDTFDEYVNSLNKKYRNPLKKVLKKKEELDIKVFEECQAIFNDRFNELYNQVNGASEFQLEKLTLDFFRETLNNKNLSTKLVTIEKDNILLGHVTIVEKENSLIPLFLGYDKTLNKEYDIYFNLVYKILEIGIQEKKKVIKFGQTADYFKQKMGCNTTNVWWYIYIKSPLLRPFTKYLFSKMFPPIENYKFELFKKIN